MEKQDSSQDNKMLEQLLEQSNQINSQLEQLNNHKLVQAYNSIPRLLWFHLLKGIAFSLGSILGATVVLSSIVYILSQMEFIPVVGDWVSEIIKVVKARTEN